MLHEAGYLIPRSMANGKLVDMEINGRKTVRNEELWRSVSY